VSNDSDTNASEASTDSRATTVGDWNGPLPKEDSVTRMHRIQQGLWRAEKLHWPAGEPQKDRRVRDRYPTLPNWLAETHQGASVVDEGPNLMSREARSYTRDRLRVLETVDGKAETDRLWRNLLSSQPMAFSIAGHLHAHLPEAAALLSALSEMPIARLIRLAAGTESLASYALDGIDAEWFPPRSAHTGDMSGCDIAACLELTDGRHVLLTVEVKYTDTFSAKPVAWDRYEEHLTALGLDEVKTAALVEAGCSQVLRQVMVSDSTRRRGLAPGAGHVGHVDAAVAVVLAREDDTAAREVTETLDLAVGDIVPVQFWSHRRLIHEAAKIQGLSEWAGDMAVRYLGNRSLMTTEGESAPSLARSGGSRQPTRGG
jgi:hypothetical protein